jgi:hypothetical protein
MNRFKDKRIFILGYGDIAQAIVDLIVQEGGDVYVTCREAFDKEGVNFVSSDSWPLLFSEYAFDFILSTKGILHDNTHLPEKTIINFDYDWFLSSLSVNVAPTIELIKSVQLAVKKSQSFLFLSFSARVGSISDNELGGWYSYRMSKAALNMLLKSVSCEWRFSLPRAHVLAYHPGTVLTNLSQPFQDHFKSGQAFTPKEAASHCIACLLAYKTFSSGSFVDWQQKVIPY